MGVLLALEVRHKRGLCPLSVAMTLLVGGQEGNMVCNKLDVGLGLLVVTI